MRHLSIFLYIVIIVTGCKGPIPNSNITIDKQSQSDTTLYSKFVKDSFVISVYNPSDNPEEKINKYPIVYLLDANLYFDIMATTIKKYSEVGLLTPVILVGVGYKDFQLMDSLRQRDYTFPVAIPEYEMSRSGGADKFHQFLTEELDPYIKGKFKWDHQNTILMGHSLGGYCTLYALEQKLLNKKSPFNSFIAASPSTQYNHNYILEQFSKIHTSTNPNISVYATFGGLEDDEEEDLFKIDSVLLSLNNSLKRNNKINYSGEVYSNFNHMDTPIPTFIKGLQSILMTENE